MAYYKFVCPNCGLEEEIKMPISEYKATGHYCVECDTELVRDVGDFCTSSKRNIPGFFGTSKKN